MTKWRDLTAEDAAYLATGRGLLRQILPNTEVFEGPELNAIYAWCLEQNWPGEVIALEEYGPVLAVGVGVGDEIAKATGMEWIWVEADEFDWFGAALKMPGLKLFTHPTRMVAQRLADRLNVRMDSLIEGTIADLQGLEAYLRSDGTAPLNLVPKG